MDRLAAAYQRVRKATRRLCAPLEIEDHVVQPIADVSPPKWHLGHTTWFFETFLLEAWLPGYKRFDESYAGVFNSYYQSLGSPYPRDRRGTRSRPTVKDVVAYRDAVDEAVLRLIARGAGDDFERALILGLNHEQQHQELLAADIKFILAHNGALAYSPGGAFWPLRSPETAAPARAVAFSGGVFRIGHGGAGFSFDNEAPRHEVALRPFLLAGRLATNGEYRRFIDDGGYRDFRHWLSDGWDILRAEDWTAPLYWGDHLDPEAPVCHLSYYEADAFARWAGARLATEAEWELAAASGRAAQLFGRAWQWTSSAYGPYPGYRPVGGAFGEYNGKFMSGQMVLRGGSCATPSGHERRTYRNFFQPEKRWQFTGVRLAWDG